MKFKMFTCYEFPKLLKGTFFGRGLVAHVAFAHRGRYDGILAMYHDQGLAPVKALAFDRAVNVTLGLPVVRTSPAHGTAFDLAGKGRADPASMRAALRWAERLTTRQGAVTNRDLP